MQIWDFVILGIVLALGVFVWRLVKQGSARGARMLAEHNQRVEAMFSSMFPDLQPHFHPARGHEYVKARRARAGASAAFKWRGPPGFPAAAEADVEPEGERERVRLLDAAGALLGEFVFEEHPEGGTLRMGKGKFTVNIREPVARVRYWHPDREFKWTAPNNWKFQSRLDDHSLDSTDTGSSTSSSSSDSTSSIARGAAAGAGIAAAGGAFDGGGASHSWDDGGSSSSASSGSSTDFSSVSSGSSSSASSTSY